MPTAHSQAGSSGRAVDEGTLLVADPRPATRISLSQALRNNGFSRVLEVDSVSEFDVVIARGIGGELALLSVEFGVEVGRMIRDLDGAGWLRTLVTVAANDPAPVIAAIGAGACGFLRGAPARLGITLDPVPTYRLTERELMVVRLVADGRSNKWIGQQLGLSVLTVKSHLARISRKFGTGDRAHIVAKAMRAGTIS